MGRTTVKIKVENIGDIELLERGYIDESKVRSLEIEALVDTGAGMLCLTPELIEKLGLRLLKEINVDTAIGVIKRKVYKNARLTILDRNCPIDVVEINSSKHQALVGYIPLEALDLVIDPKAQKVTTNPEHHGEMIIDLL